MRENTPDPYVAQTGFDEDDAWRAEDLDDEAFDIASEDADDELEVEEERARER